MSLQPVWNGYLADPFIFEAQGTFWMTGTGGSGEPVFPLLSSEDLVNWTPSGHLIEGEGNFWAPEIAKGGDGYLLYYSSGGPNGENHQLRVSTSKVPNGPYRPIVEGLLPDEDFSIDAHPFIDPISGERYLFFCKDFFDDRVGTGIAAVSLAADGITVTSEPTTILRATGDWHIFERNRRWYGKLWPAWHTVEGPFVVFRDGRYWLFYSGGLWNGPDYGVGCAVADHPLGPYVEPEPGPSVLSNSPTLRGPGHNSVLGTDTIAFHAWNEGFTKRQPYLANLKWTELGPRVIQ